MNCYYHPAVVALGNCKSCHKGLCLECAADVGKGLACKGSCEEDVKKLNHLIDQNISLGGASKALVSGARRVYLGNGIFYLTLGLLFLVAGLSMTFLSSEGIAAGLLPIIFGLLILIFGGFYLRRGLAIPAKSD